MSGSDTLIIMTRFPREGRNKTRLIPALGASGATALHERLAKHTIHTAERFLTAHPAAHLEVHLDGATPEESRKWLGEVVCIAQVPGDLGQRMLSAAEGAFSRGARRVLIIGTDCPTLDETAIAQAFHRLNDSDIVLGPAADGGYYLIGMNQPRPELFTSIEWGSSRVLEQTLHAAKIGQLDVAELAILEDVDTPADLPAAFARLDLSSPQASESIRLPPSVFVE